MKKDSIIEYISFSKKIDIKNVETTYNENGTDKKYNKPQLCDELEKQLRENDKNSKDKKRWFYNQLETILYKLGSKEPII